MVQVSKALNIPVFPAVVSEAKPHARSMILQNHADHVLALFADMEEVTRGKGFELQHGVMANICFRQIDIAILCAPCQAFSTLRGDTSKVAPESHGSYNVQMSKSRDYIAQRLPHLVIQEQVRGRFTAAGRDGGPSQMELYIKSIQSITEGEGDQKSQVYKGALVMFLDSSDWIPSTRKRCYMAFSKSKEMLERVGQRVTAWIDKKATYTLGPSRP